MKKCVIASALAALAALASTIPACHRTCDEAPLGGVGEPTDWERRFLAERRLPAVEAREALVAEDGLRLSYTDWVPDGFAGEGSVVLFVHGSSVHGGVYSALGKGMQQRGVLARVIDLRGHGYSRCPSQPTCDPRSTPSYKDDGTYWPGRPGDSADVEQLGRDLFRHVRDLRDRYPRARIFLSGHSSGAGLVARYVQSMGMSELAGAILLAPFLHPDQPQNDLSTWDCGRVVGTTYARVKLGAVGEAQRGNTHRYVLDLAKGPAYADPLDTIAYTWTTMTGLATRDATSFHAAFTAPTLWIAGERDALLDLERSRPEHAKLPGRAGFVTVRDTSHVGVSWSPRVAELMASFAKDTAAAVPPVVDPE